MEASEQYDLVVMGGGPAGYAAAMRAIDYGKRVCLIERNRVGGAGVYNGALGSKTLWELSQKVHSVNETIVSEGRKEFEITWEEAVKTKNEAIFDRKFQYSCHLQLLQNETLRKVFTYERGFGTMLDPNHVKIVKDDEEKIVETKYILISTGSRPRVLPNIDVDGTTIMTSDHIHHVDDYPKSMVIVGAGVIGCEYATIFTNFGKTKVYLIDRADQVLPFEDDDVSEIVSNNLQRRGCVLHQNAQLERLEKVEGEIEYELSYPDGRREVIRVEKALLAVGRVPNIEGIGMEAAGVSMSKRGRHIGDDDTQTNIPNIFVAGDASGRIALVNMGELEARHAVERMFGAKRERLSYDNVSTIMFLQPEVASVGMNEKQAMKAGLNFRVAKIDYSCISRAIAMRKTEGFFKILVSDDDDMRIIGMRAIGEHASSAIQAVALLIQMNKGIRELAELVHPHPSIIEGIQECARMLLNKSVFKSSVFKDKLQCYRHVNGERIPLQRL